MMKHEQQTSRPEKNRPFSFFGGNNFSGLNLYYYLKRHVYFTVIFSCIIFLISATTAFSAPKTTTFSWWHCHSIDTVSDNDYHTSPRPGYWYPNAEHEKNIYDALYENDNIMSVGLINYTSPFNGTNKTVLSTVMGYVQRLDYVFLDIERELGTPLATDSQIHDEICDIVAMVRNSSNANIKNARIGQHDWYPGNTCFWLAPNYYRTTESNYYLDSGLNCAMPCSYPFAHMEFLTWSVYPDGYGVPPELIGTTLWGNDVSPNKRSALFWAPLEIYSTAKRALPSGHQIIPYVSCGITEAVYSDAPEPTRTDCRALLQHIRLRGADGYYAFTMSPWANTNYSNDEDYIRDMIDAWRDLDDMCEGDGVAVLNLDTNKIGGLEYSGVRNGNRIRVLVSNLGNSSQRANYPGKWNLPAQSDAVAPGQHVFFDYTIGNLLLNGNFNTGSSYWYLYSGAATRNASQGINNSGCLKLQGGYLSARGTQYLYVEPKAKMKISYYAKGQHGAKLSMGYYSYDKNNVSLGTTVAAASIEPSSVYQKYESYFIIPDNPDIASIRPIFYNVYGATDANDIIWIDDMTIEFTSNDHQMISFEFDENTSTNTYEKMGNISAGTIHGASWTTGISGSALNFDGVNDYVDFGTSAALNLTGSRTISAWIKPDAAVENYSIIAAKHAWGYSLYTYGSSLRGIVKGTSNSASSISSTNITVGEWQHVAMTFDVNGDKKVHLYINGVEVSSYTEQTTLSGTPDGYPDEPFAIGATGAGAYYPFDGAIDEVKVFAWALNAQEILDEATTVLSADFSEGAGGITTDSSIFKNAGEIHGASWATGISGNALNFDGVNNYVNFGTPAALNLTGSRTISAWIKPDTADANYRIIAAKHAWGYSLYTYGSSLRGFVKGTGNSASSISSTNITVGEWQHVAMTFDVNGDKKVHLYVNGVEVSYAGGEQTTLSGTPDGYPDEPFAIGATGAGGYPFDGAIDEVKVFARAINAQEILDEATTILSVDFYEGTGRITTDSSMYKNAGEIHGASWATGMFGNALNFDGVNDYVDFGTPAALDLTGSRTISAWIKPDAAVADYSIIAAKHAWGYSLYTYGSSLRGFVKGTGDSASSISSTNITVGEWQHVAMTFDVNGDKKVHLYINGVEVSSYAEQTTLSGTPDGYPSAPFAIGATGDGSVYPFDGAIDEVKVFARALNVQEILDEATTVLSADFSAGAGDIITDSSIFKNNGYVYGASWTTGISGNALNFDGANDYVHFNTSATLDLTGSRAISAWIKPDAAVDSFGIIAAKNIWGFSLYTYGSSLRGFVKGTGDSASSISSTNITVGAWQHVAMTFDVNGDKKVHLYINGVEVSYAEQTTLSGTPETSPTVLFAIGATCDGSGYHFDGAIDEVKVFARALNAQEILDQATTVLSVDFHEGTKNITTDSSTFKNAGEIHGASWTTGGISGSALDFDGVNNYVDFGTPAALGLTGSRSISAWIKPDATGTTYSIIAAKHAWGYSLYTYGSSLCGFVKGTGNSASSISSTNITVGAWQHVAMTFDVNGDKKVHLYINGVEVSYVGGRTELSGTPDGYPTEPFAIGATGAGGYPFDGAIDEVKVYSRALSSTDVDNLYQEFGN